MKTIRMVILALVLLTVAVPPMAVDAHRGGRGGGHWGHYRGSWGWGVAPWVATGALAYGLYGYPYYYPYRYPYAFGYGYPYYPPYYPETAPAVQPVQPLQPQQQFWYYCESAKTYYPYVPSCREAWRVVPITPPAPGVPNP